MSADDILDHEIGRLQGLVENRRVPFLRRLSQSKPALFTIAIMAFLFQLRNLPETLANSSLDAAIAIQKPVPTRSVRLVTIDDEDYENLFHSRSPLDPAVLSTVLRALAKGHARANRRYRHLRCFVPKYGGSCNSDRVECVRRSTGRW